MEQFNVKILLYTKRTTIFVIKCAFKITIYYYYYLP